MKYRKNKENDDLPQINLAMLCGKESKLPVYYRKLSGNIPDVKTIENLLKDIDFLEIDKLTLVMNRGFYSVKNINDQHCADDRDRFNHLLDRCEEELLSGEKNPDHENMYRKYFEVHETPVRGKKAVYNEDAILKAEKDYGFFTLMSNDIKDPAEALRVYRLRNLIEKSFGNLKERLSMRRMSVSSEESFEGKLFVQFIALELMSYIKKQMDGHGLYRNYTMQSLLDELDTIEYYQQPGRTHYLSEITENQRKLYECMDVKVPS